MRIRLACIFQSTIKIKEIYFLLKQKVQNDWAWWLSELCALAPGILLLFTNPSCSSALLSRMATQSPTIMFQVTRKEERHEKRHGCSIWEETAHFPHISLAVRVTNTENWGRKTHLTGGQCFQLKIQERLAQIPAVTGSCSGIARQRPKCLHQGL